MKLLSLFQKKSRDDEIVDHETLNDLNRDEQVMIRGIVELSDTKIKEVIIPRIDVVFLSDDIERVELFETLIESGHSRFPVFSETIDNVVGVLYVKDLLGYMVDQHDFSIRDVMRKPYFVPESMRLDSLLKEFKRRRVHIAIVVDEYGGVSGVVCMEDIIEEIVGDIQDEFDNEQDEITTVEEGIYICDARVDIEDLNERTGLNLPEEKFDSLGGFVFDLFGKIPVKYEKVAYGNIDFIIQSVDGHKIKMVKIIEKNEEQV